MYVGFLVDKAQILAAGDAVISRSTLRLDLTFECSCFLRPITQLRGRENIVKYEPKFYMNLDSQRYRSQLQAASETKRSASSIAWVAAFPELGTNVCAASPSWTTRPPGEAHWGCGSLHMSFQSVISSFGVVRMTLFIISGQPGILAVNLRTSSFEVRSCQDSVVVPSSCQTVLETTPSMNLWGTAENIPCA